MFLVLFNEYLAWIPQSAHQELALIWPPLE